MTDAPVLYANMVGIAATAVDVRLDFVRQGAAEDASADRPVAAVYLPPAAAKMLAALLAELVAAYEGQFGAIAVPPVDPRARDREG